MGHDVERFKEDDDFLYGTKFRFNCIFCPGYDIIFGTKEDCNEFIHGKNIR